MKNRTIDLSQLTVPQLLGIRNQLLEIRGILSGGIEATAETAKAKRLREAEAQLTELKKREKYREICESYDLHFDDDPAYFLSFSEEHLYKTCEMLSHAKRQTALAERFGNSIAIPPLFSAEELSSIELVRQGFKDRKNGHRE
jgi:hypothetical protein